MKNKVLIISVLSLMLLFGCTGPSQTPSEETKDSGDAMEDTMEETADEPMEETTEEQMEETTEETMEEPEEETLEGKNYNELAALGVPLECTMKVDYDGAMTQSKVYLKGDGQVRTEVVIEDAPCDKFIYILKDDVGYMGCEEGSIFGEIEQFEDCNWLEFSTEEPEGETTSGDTTVTYSATTPALEDVPSTEIQCAPWVVDSSKFDVSGKVCNLDQMMEDLYGS